MDGFDEEGRDRRLGTLKARPFFQRQEYIRE